MNVIKFENIALTDAERQPCEVWTRVMGYHRPVSEFNRGKKSEYYSRLCFTEEKAVSHLDNITDTCACAAEQFALNIFAEINSAGLNIGAVFF